MKLGKGINYSRYCWQWRGSEANDLNDYMDGTNPSGTDFISADKLKEAQNHVEIIKQMGFDTIRLPITFHCWSAFNTNNIDPNHQYWNVLDNMIDACNSANLNLVICYHHAPTMDLERVLSHWMQIALRPNVLNATKKVLFEIFNEPTDAISNADFRLNAISIIDEIRQIPAHLNRWAVVGGNFWNDIGFANAGLTDLQPLGLQNILYTFHSYEPKVFTNQGFKGENCYKTTGISFPFKLPMPPIQRSGQCAFNEDLWKYNNYTIDNGNGTGFGMGTAEFIQKRIEAAKNWSIVHGNLPIWCGEWGFHRHMPTIPNDGSINNFFRAMVSSFKLNDIDWCWWDFEGPFTLFNPVPDIVNEGDAFGKTLTIILNLDPDAREILELNERISFEILTIKRNLTTKKDTIRLSIDCQDDISNIANFEIHYTYQRKFRNNLIIGFGKNTLVSAKKIKTSITQLGLAISFLKVIHKNGTSFEVKIS